MPIHVIGNPISPYVRKIFIALLLEGVEFDFDLIPGLIDPSGPSSYGDAIFCPLPKEVMRLR